MLLFTRPHSIAAFTHPPSIASTFVILNCLFGLCCGSHACLASHPGSAGAGTRSSRLQSATLPVPDDFGTATRTFTCFLLWHASCIQSPDRPGLVHVCSTPGVGPAARVLSNALSSVRLHIPPSAGASVHPLPRAFPWRSLPLSCADNTLTSMPPSPLPYYPRDVDGFHMRSRTDQVDMGTSSLTRRLHSSFTLPTTPI